LWPQETAWWVHLLLFDSKGRTVAGFLARIEILDFAAMPTVSVRESPIPLVSWGKLSIHRCPVTLFFEPFPLLHPPLPAQEQLQQRKESLGAIERAKPRQQTIPHRIPCSSVMLVLFHWGASLKSAKTNCYTWLRMGLPKRNATSTACNDSRLHKRRALDSEKREGVFRC